MERLIVAVGTASISLISVPVSAQAVDLSAQRARLREAIAQAEQAKEAAEVALLKATEAIAVLKRSLNEAPTPAKRPLTSALAMAAKDKPAEVIARLPARPSSMPACDAPEPNSIANYMLDMENGLRKRKQKKESSYTPGEQETNEGINAFVYHCLGLAKATDYESTTNLSAQFTGTKGSDQIEAVITRTARGIKATTKDGKPALASTYNRYSFGGFGRTGASGEATLIDLTESNFSSGVGLLAGFEWGRMPAQPQGDVKASIRAGIAKARQECLAAHWIDDPLKSGATPGLSRPQLVLDPVSQCEGDALVSWIVQAKRGNQYWTDIVSPLWGYGKTPNLFAGVQARYAFQDISYRPIIDPMTGGVIATTLPPLEKIHPQPYSVKLYGGFSQAIRRNDKLEATIGLTASVTYRREVDFIDGTNGKTICSPAGPGADFDICSTDQKLASPYQTSGFVAGIGLNLQSRRFWYLPPIAIAPRFTYAFDTKRRGIEVPLFFLTDADGKLNSGFKYTCRFRGETPEGFELKKSCNVNLFVGTSFDLGKAP